MTDRGKHLTLERDIEYERSVLLRMRAQGRKNCTPQEWHDYGQRLARFTMDHGPLDYPLRVLSDGKPRPISQFPGLQQALAAGIEDGTFRLTGRVNLPRTDHE